MKVKGRCVWLLLFVSVLVFVFDQWSKHAVIECLSQEHFLRVTSFFNLSLAFNTGAAFSMLADGGVWSRYGLSFLALCVVIGLLVWWWMERSYSRLATVAVGLLVGGALGNVWDRLRYGMVVDFIDLHWGGWHFATFNVADSAVTAGVCLLLLQGYCYQRTSGQNKFK